MAPLSQAMADLAKRYTYCPSGYYSSGYNCYRRSGWYWWGRWVFAGVIIVVILFIVILLACINARRRKRQGLAPRYGTGWMAGAKYGPGYNNPQGYNQGYNQNYQPPPPQYSQQPAQNQYTGNSNDGYYGNHEGIALQQPQNSYYPRSGDGGYEPPAGPPPSKIN